MSLSGLSGAKIMTPMLVVGPVVHTFTGGSSSLLLDLQVQGGGRRNGEGELHKLRIIKYLRIKLP